MRRPHLGLRLLTLGFVCVTIVVTRLTAAALSLCDWLLRLLYVTETERGVHTCESCTFAFVIYH